MSQTEEASASGGGSEESSTQEGTFECNICLDTAKDAVVSLCGHLFCWPCLHRWLETRPNRQVCPVCKAVISREKVIPLYGRGASKQDPREKLPPRPPGQRTEPENSTGQTFPAFGFGDGGFHMSFGIGAFPFGIFTSSFNFGDGRPAPDRNIGGIHNIGGNIFIADNSDNSSEEGLDYISDDFEERENDRDEEENSYSDNSSDEDFAYIDDDLDETSEDSIDDLDEDEMSESEDSIDDLDEDEMSESEDSIDDLDEDETSEDSIDDLGEMREAEEDGGNNFVEYSPCNSSDEDSDYQLEQ